MQVKDLLLMQHTFYFMIVFIVDKTNPIYYTLSKYFFTTLSDSSEKATSRCCFT